MRPDDESGVRSGRESSEPCDSDATGTCASRAEELAAWLEPAQPEGRS